jgi:membrane protease YdiL (CAAX protease family)
MEDQSAPEQRSPQATERTVVRIPGLEFAMGVALFAIVFMVFFLVQTSVFIAGVLDRTPEFSSEGFSLGLLTDESFRLRMDALIYNGDLVARQAIWSGLVGSLFILGGVWLWKRNEAAEFLGLRSVHIKRYLPWAGLFILMVLLIEGLGYLSPAFRTDFMAKVLESSTSLPMLLLGVGIMAPVFEELLLRGLLLGSIRNIADEHASIFITAGLFTLMHLQYSWSVMLLILPMGILLGYARTRSGSILVPVLLHVLNNSLSVLWG